MTNSKKYTENYILAFLGWWLLWVLLQWTILSRAGFSNIESITDAFISNLLLAAACFVVSNNMRYYLPRHEKYWYVLTISLVLASFWLILFRLTLWALFRQDISYILFLQQSSTVRFSFSFLMIGCMSTVSLLWYTQKEQQEREEQKKEIESLAKEAELFKLRQQLQPHFLFNSLNSISALTGSQPEKARHMIQQLSDFLRGTLRTEEKNWNTLAEELDYLNLYLDIEKVRFGDRLETKIEIQEGIETSKIPALLLQPILENAIKFGLYDTIGEVIISIKVEKLNNLLHVTVTNPFDAETAQPLVGTGFGLASTRRRLFLLYGRSDLLQAIPETNYFTTQVIIPQGL